MRDTSCREQCHSRSSDTVFVSLVFEREQLLYDIRNYAYIEGHVWSEGSRHARHTLVDIGEAGNIDRVNRILSAVYAEAVEMLYPYTKEEAIEDEVICDELWIPEEYHINMNVPATMSRTTLHLLNRHIHEYMVARVIYDWLSITHPEAARNWLDKAQKAEDEINSIKNQRTRLLTRPLSPF